MSEGTSSDQNLSLEEYQKKSNIQTQIFYDKFYEFESKIRDIPSFKDNIAKIFDIISELRAEFYRKALENRDLALDAYQKLSDEKIRFLSFEKKLEEFEKKLDIIKDFTEDQKGFNESFSKKVTNIEETSIKLFCKKSDVLDMDKSFDFSLDRIRQKIYDQATDIESIQSAIKSLFVSKEMLDSSHKDLKDKVEKVSCQHVTKISDHREEINEQLKRTVDALEAKIELLSKDISSLKMEINTVETDLDMIESDFHVQLNDACLNASNASCRSINAEANIKILDKKIEKISLMVNKPG